MPSKFVSLADEFPFAVESLFVRADDSRAYFVFANGECKSFSSEERARQYIKKNYAKLIRGTL